MSDLDWEFINSFAPWFSAIGTMSAVLVALYLARKDKNPSLYLETMIMEEVYTSVNFLYLRVVNIGARPIHIKHVGLKIASLKPRKAFQKFNDNDKISTKLPTTLNYGEEAKFFLDLDDNYLDSLKKFLKWFPRYKLNFLYFQVFTSINKTFEVKLDNSSIKYIRSLFN